MDYAYMGKILLSSIFFAPGLILLAGALVVGVLMLVEKWGVLEVLGAKGAAKTTEATANAVEAPNKIVGELKLSLDSNRDDKVEQQKRN